MTFYIDDCGITIGVFKKLPILRQSLAGGGRGGRKGAHSVHDGGRGVRHTPGLGYFEDKETKPNCT